MKSRPALLALLLSFSALPASPAAAVTLEVTLDPGKHDRRNVPVKAVLALPKEHAKMTVLKQTGVDGKPLLAQITAPGLLAPGIDGDAQRPLVQRELHLVVPSLAAGKKTTLTFEPAGPNETVSGGFAWKDTKGEYADLSRADKNVLRYMYAPLDPSRREQTYKVFHHVWSPDGKQIVTKGAGGLYTHHRGLFYGFNRVTFGDGKRADIWHCSNAHQSHEKLFSQESGPAVGRHLVEIGWNGGKTTFARERREMTAYNTRGGVLIEFASTLASTDGGKIHLDGDPQHAGFHFRATNEVATQTKGQTYFLRPDGRGKPRETRNWPGHKTHVDLPWNAMSFVVGGQRYTACYLDRPANPKQARFSERDYGRFGSYFVYDVTAERPLVVNYRVWLQAGEMTGNQVAAHSTNFVDPATATVKFKP